MRNPALCLWGPTLGCPRGRLAVGGRWIAGSGPSGSEAICLEQIPSWALETAFGHQVALVLPARGLGGMSLSRKNPGHAG